jgi:hypothetical protein
MEPKVLDLPKKIATRFSFCTHNQATPWQLGVGLGVTQLHLHQLGF